MGGRWDLIGCWPRGVSVGDSKRDAVSGRRQDQWFAAFSSERMTIGWAPNFAWALVVSMASLVSSADFHHPQLSNYTAERLKDYSDGDYLYRLLKVLGIQHASQKVRHPTPPQYMLDLYNSVAGSGGITHAPNPYYANVIRSYSDRDSSHQLKFFFNVSSNTSRKDRILEAEFHLYKLKPRPKAKAKLKEIHSQLLEVKVYQIIHQGKIKNGRHKLLDVRRLSLQSTGWEKFYVKDAVLDWLKNSTSNYGLLVTVRSLKDEPVPVGLIRFAKRQHHHVNKHPLLVLFVDDGRHGSKKYSPKPDFHDYGFNYHTEVKTEKMISEAHHWDKSTNSASNEPTSPMAIRKRRSGEYEDIALQDASGQSYSCTRHELYVDFEKIGWSAWIISPKGYNAYYCKGECAFPLGQPQSPTNHATVQSIVHELKLIPGVDTPCCVPNKLHAISLLYFDEHENVILKQYDDMVAGSCGCH